MPASSRSTGTRSTASWCCLPNFGDEIAVAELLSHGGLNVPVLLQACNDEVDKVDVKGRRDAFCGKISVTTNLYQYGIPFTDTTSHTSDVDGAEFAGDLDRFVARLPHGARPAARPHRRHRRANGRRSRPCASARSCCRPRGIRWSPSISPRSSATPQKIDAGEDPTCEPGWTRSSATGTIPAHIAPRQHRQAGQAGHRRRSLDGGATNATPARSSAGASMQDNFGCATCLAMSMMGEKLHALAPARSTWPAPSRCTRWRSPSGAPPALLDWNNNYGHASPTSASARIAATSPRASSARRPRSPTSTCSARSSDRKSASARSRARSSRGR